MGLGCPSVESRLLRTSLKVVMAMAYLRHLIISSCVGATIALDPPFLASLPTALPSASPSMLPVPAPSAQPTTVNVNVNVTQVGLKNLWPVPPHAQAAGCIPRRSAKASPHDAAVLRRTVTTRDARLAMHGLLNCPRRPPAPNSPGSARLARCARRTAETRPRR